MELPLLQTATLGRRIIWEGILESTNLLAEQLAASGEEEGLLVGADAQTAGRGRSGRCWFSPTGKNLYFSLLLRPQVSAAIVSQLAIVAALSLCQALSEIPLRIKWPNDIWSVDGRKICGILCTAASRGGRAESVVIGIGINVLGTAKNYPTELQGRISTLQELNKMPISRNEVLARFLNQFEKDYLFWKNANSLALFSKRWQQVDYLFGRDVRMENGANRLVSGKAAGLAADGQLLLQMKDGSIEPVASGDAHILGFSD